jgi:hypothetical protein
LWPILAKYWEQLRGKLIPEILGGGGGGGVHITESHYCKYIQT